MIDHSRLTDPTIAVKNGGAKRWEDIPYLRQYLDSLAKEKGINPLDPIAWQSVTPPKTVCRGLPLLPLIYRLYLRYHDKGSLWVVEGVWNFR
jgi:hypothetical protein